MKTSFSVKVTGSITVSIEPPSNEDGGGDGGDANDGGSILVDVLLKSLVNDAVKKYVCDKRITVEEEEEEEEEEEYDLSSPLPQRRIPADADDSIEEEEEEEASVEEEEDDDEAGDLPKLNVEYQYADDNSLSQKMTMMNLRRK
jgi:hypothetical protein